MKVRIGKKIKNTPESVQKEMDKEAVALIFLEDEDQARAEEAQEAYADDWRGFWDYERDCQ